MIYIATHKIPDIAVVTSILARNVKNLSMKLQKAALKVVNI